MMCINFYRDVAFSTHCFDNIDELEQGVQFLHENGKFK